MTGRDAWRKLALRLPPGRLKSWVRKAYVRRYSPQFAADLKRITGR